MVEKKQRLRVSRGFSWVNSAVRVWGSDSPVREELSTCNNKGNGLFNDALNTFYLRFYGVRHMVKDHSDSEIGRKCFI